MVSELFDLILLFKLIEKFVLKQSDNQYKTMVLIAKQLSILSFYQDNQVANKTYYDQFTTRVEVACQAEVCYYTPDHLDTKCVKLSCTEYETLTPAKQKIVRDVIEQEYLAYLFINNSNQKLHSQNRTEQLRKLGKLQSYYLDKFNLKGVFIRHQQVMQSSVAVKTAEQVRAPSRSVSSWELFNHR